MHQNLKILQINTNHSLHVANILLVTAGEANIDLLCITDPYLHSDILTNPPHNYKSFASTSLGALILVCNPQINCKFKFKTHSSIFVEIEFNNINFILGSSYLRPQENINSQINEFTKFDFLTNNYLLTGDFNGRSPLWGSADEETRGRHIADFIAINNLTLINRIEQGPSFKNNQGGKGNPDLTLSTPALIPFINNWEILDIDSGSDHQYILTTLGTAADRSGDFYFKTKYPLTKFMLSFNKETLALSGEINSADNTDKINYASSNLIQTVQKCAFKNIRKKPKEKKQEI